MELDEAIKSRKSVRNFSKEKPDWRDIIEAIDSVRYAPAAGNNFTLKFILVSDNKKIQKITQSAQQDFISQAHYVVIVCSDSTRLVKTFQEKGEDYGKYQAGAAIQNFLLSIEEKGLSTCWVGHFSEEQIKNALSIKKGEIVGIFPIGYENKNAGVKKTQKTELDRFLYFEKYGNKKMKSPKKFEV